jgi:hypothetical protein
MILGGRNIVDAFLQAQSREPSQRDSSSDSNAVTSAAVHRAPLRLRKSTNACYDALAETATKHHELGVHNAQTPSCHAALQPLRTQLIAEAECWGFG